MSIRRYFGDKAFYRMVMVIVVPIIIQNAFTQFVNMLDNIMVGQIGTLPMSAVSISNQLLQVINLAIIGSVGAIGIFGAQFYGKKDMKGFTECIYIKLLAAAIFVSAGILIFFFKGRYMVSFYMDETTNTAAEITDTLNYAETYIRIMIIGLIPFGLSSAMSTISREAGKTLINMYSGIVSVLVNFVLNYLLIFGHFGFPEMGVAGAAVATVISRFVELFVVMFGLWHDRESFPFLPELAGKFHISGDLLKRSIIKGMPLTINEILWSGGLAMIAQCYSLRGIEAIAAINIVQTITNVFHIMCKSMGHAIGILVGQKLGAGEIEEAKDIDRKLLATSILINVFLCFVLLSIAHLFPTFYNTTDSVRSLAEGMLRIAAVWMPVQAIYYSCYFTLRAGGKTVITFLFDSAYTCTISLAVAFTLTHFTALPMLFIYLFVTLADLPKAIIGLTLLKKGVWANNLVK